MASCIIREILSDIFAMLNWRAIIQLIQSFEVNIRICQFENSDIHCGEAKNNTPIVLLTIVLLNGTVSLFLFLFQVIPINMVRCYCASRVNVTPVFAVYS